MLNDRATVEELKLYFDIKIREIAATKALTGAEDVGAIPTANKIIESIWFDLEREFAVKDEKKQTNEAR